MSRPLFDIVLPLPVTFILVVNVPQVLQRYDPQCKEWFEALTSFHTIYYKLILLSGEGQWSRCDQAIR